MVARDVLTAAGRRWYVVLVGLAITGLVLMHLQRMPGVFSARTTVVFVAAQSANNPNTLNLSTNGLIQTASVVERDINRGQDLPVVVSPNIRIIDRGVRDGSVVFLPNYGSQFVIQNTRAILIVDVVAPTIKEVSARTRALVKRIAVVTDRIQAESHVKPVNRITTKPSPPEPLVSYDQGKPKQAEGAAGLLGLAGTLTAAVGVDRLLLALAAARRRRRRHAQVLTGPVST